MREPKVLLLDTENAPNVSYTWGKYDQNVLKFKSNWYFLCFAYKWLGDKTVKCHTVGDFPATNKPHSDEDGPLVNALWKVIDEADVVVGHNADRFDLRKANARFAFHGLKPPSPYKTVDTLKVARKFFQFDSNRLDDLGQYLGLGEKLPNTGIHLWLGCMAREPAALRLMRRYCSNDVALLERVYLRLRPWANHPDLNHLSRLHACPTCQSPRIQGRGFAFTKTGKRQRIQCTDCGAWSTTGPLIKEGCPLD